MKTSRDVGQSVPHRPGSARLLPARLVPARLVLAVAVLCVLVGAALPVAAAPALRLQLESREVHAGLPFVLTLTAEGFDEDPPPDLPSIAIDDCKVTYLGMSPSVSSMVRIINGQRYESKDVRQVYRYRVEAARAGSYRVPPVTVTQGQKTANSPGGTFTVQELDTTRDMKIRLALPDRPIYVGETFDVTLDWYLRSNVQDQSFSVPLFDIEAIHVEPGTVASPQGALSFPAGARDLEVPYQRDSVTEGGVQFTRFRFALLANASRPGAYELEPAKVVARLETGVGRDRFGFRVPQRQLFIAKDERKRLSVRRLPQADRPASFANAIGSAFSIQVQASRTVVRVGDPIDLNIQIRGDGRLEGLSLPKLDADGGLPPALFSVPDDLAPGVIAEDGNSKSFTVSVRLKSDEAREIPALPFSYFDPTVAEYKTIWSQPIALSVAGSAIVGAADVVGARPSDGPGTAGEALPGASAPKDGFLPGSLVGADLSLSALGDARPAASVERLRPLLIALYALPVLIFGLRLYWVRTHRERGRSSEVKQAVKEAEKALATARTQPARDAAPPLLNALRAVARMAGAQAAARTTLERIETEAFHPQAAAKPLADHLLKDARAALKSWTEAARTNGGGDGDGDGHGIGRKTAVLALLLATSLTTVATANAEEIAAASAGDRLSQARELYGRALAEQDRVRRTRTFAEAATVFAELAAEPPNQPDLLTDWGNAALGAQDLGRAALAYKRALALDPGHERARKNLNWVRSRTPRWLPPPASRSAVDSLFFWHHTMSLAQRHLTAAVAFAIAILVLAPWPSRRARSLRRLAYPALAVWLAMVASIALEADPRRAAVIIHDGITLRSADSDGAPATLATPLPAGAEVTVIEARDGWTRVILSDGSKGWLKSHAIERVAG